MNAKQIVREVMKQMKVTQTELLDLLKGKFNVEITAQSLNDRLSLRRTNSLTTANLNQMVKCLGYKVVVVPENWSVPSSGFELNDGLTPKAEGETK